VLTLQYLINSPAVARLNLLLIGGWLATVVFLLELYRGVQNGETATETRIEILVRFSVTCFSMLVSTYCRLTEVSPVNRHLVRNTRTDGNQVSMLATFRSRR
jgi:hypothetical protein